MSKESAAAILTKIAYEVDSRLGDAIRNNQGDRAQIAVVGISDLYRQFLQEVSRIGPAN